MKKKLFISGLATMSAVCCMVGLAACGKTSMGKTKEFIRVSDGVFTSAGYTSPVSGGKKSVGFNKTFAAANGVNAEINKLYTAVKTDSNTGLLDDYNLNYIKGDTLYQGANLAGMFKSMTTVLGDEVFSNTYDLTKIGMPGSVAKLVDGEYYTLYGVSREGKAITSAIQIDFKEYAAGNFVFKLAQYNKLDGISELHFSYYDSASTAFVATLQGDASVDFKTYDADYESFTVAECTIAIFGNDEYVSDTGNGSEHDETILKFVKENLNYNNQTYQTLAGISGGKSIGNKEANKIESLMYQNRYVNPYTGTNDNVSVSKEYTIPSDVTVVASASIPATKKLIVPAHVEKILDGPFKYPQYVEEIVFEDPDNGALVQIGNDDIVDDLGGFVYRANHSRNFLLSYTKVKNFTLPKTVKKLEGPIYITTDMEVLDLSNYHPDYELPDDKGRDAGYSVTIGSSVFNRAVGIYKELGSIEKLYINQDFTLELRRFVETDFDPQPGETKIHVTEYSTNNKAEDKNYYYSPTEEIFYAILGIYGEYSAQNAAQYIQSRKYTKVNNLVAEVITTGLNEAFDIDSELFEKLTLTIDVEDFADVYRLLTSSETGKEFSLKLIENGQPKTMLKLFYNNEQGMESNADTMISVAAGQYKRIAELEFQEDFLAPSAMDSYIIVSGEKQYFAGWSFKKDASRVDVAAGEKVKNFFQNMYAVYLPATAGVNYTENENGGYTASINAVNTDIIVIADTYNGKQVNEVVFGSYTCKKIILPMSVNTANKRILSAIAENQLNGFKGVTTISDIEGGWNIDSLLLEKLKTCNGVVEENGLYYIRSDVSNYYMLFAADEDLTERVYISSDCYIIAVEFGSGVTSIYMPNDDQYSRLKYISRLKFHTIGSFSIPGSVVYAEYISGTVTGYVSISLKERHNLKLYHMNDFHADYIWVPVGAFDADYLHYEFADTFRGTGIKLYLDCTYEQIASVGFTDVCEEMYFYSPDEPNYDDPDVANYRYWHYDSNFNFVIWE